MRTLGTRVKFLELGLRLAEARSSVRDLEAILAAASRDLENAEQYVESSVRPDEKRGTELEVALRRAVILLKSLHELVGADALDVDREELSLATEEIRQLEAILDGGHLAPPASDPLARAARRREKALARADAAEAELARQDQDLSEKMDDANLYPKVGRHDVVFSRYHECDKSFMGRCLYDNLNDPSHEQCLACGKPEVRK